MHLYYGLDKQNYIKLNGCGRAGRLTGAGVKVEEEMTGKCPGMGCVCHVIERLEESGFRHLLGPTSGPEECFARRFRTWFNESKKKTTNNVKHMRNFIIDHYDSYFLCSFLPYDLLSFFIFSCGHATIYKRFCPLVGWLVGW